MNSADNLESIKGDIREYIGGLGSRFFAFIGYKIKPIIRNEPGTIQQAAEILRRFEKPSVLFLH